MSLDRKNTSVSVGLHTELGLCCAQSLSFRFVTPSRSASWILPSDSLNVGFYRRY